MLQKLKSKPETPPNNQRPRSLSTVWAVVLGDNRRLQGPADSVPAHPDPRSGTTLEQREVRGNEFRILQCARTIGGLIFGYLVGELPTLRIK